MSKQKKDIKPYQLIIIGFVLLLPSIFHLIPSMYAGILVWFALLFWAVALFKAIGGLFKKTDSSSTTPDSTELIKVWREITDGDRTWGWKPIIAAIVHINSIPEDVIDVAEKTNGSASNKFPRQANGYDGILWIARENKPYEPDHMLIFSPVFNNITDKKWWENTPLMLSVDIESWLEIKEVSEKKLVIGDNVKITPLTDDRDFAILAALLKTKKYKDAK